MSETIGQPFMDSDGIEVILSQDTHRAIYPYPHYVVGFRLQPTPAGKRSRAYQTITGMLGDDWSTDVTSEPELLVEAFRSAGLADSETESILNAAHTLRQTQPLMEHRS